MTATGRFVSQPHVEVTASFWFHLMPNWFDKSNINLWRMKSCFETLLFNYSISLKVNTQTCEMKGSSSLCQKCAEQSFPEARNPLLQTSLVILRSRLCVSEITLYTNHMPKQLITYISQFENFCFGIMSVAPHQKPAITLTVSRVETGVNQLLINIKRNFSDDIVEK